jgi:hypothetical protein
MRLFWYKNYQEYKMSWVQWYMLSSQLLRRQRSRGLQFEASPDENVRPHLNKKPLISAVWETSGGRIAI